MNHIYRLRWNRSLAQWIVTSELSRRATRGHGSRRRSAVRAHLLAATSLGLSLGYACSALAAPTGGTITAGSGQITQSGSTTTIQQNSQNLSLGWQSFDVGAQETVSFVQPNASALAVNRIFSASASEILGHLHSNGQVWLINPNGVLFGAHSQVNVGGLVASTLDTVGDNSSGSQKFSGTSQGSVVNQGTITAASGGYVALLGHRVSNLGVISAQLGTVALGAGSAQTLTFNGNHLVHLQVDASQLNDLVENRQLIQANGGQVFMTAGAKDAVLASVVNNTGFVQAETVENRNGTIVLLAGGAGTVNVDGTLDASAPRGGDGGSIETSGAKVNIAAGANVHANAPAGHSGTWLVDPTDLTIDTGAASTIAQSLNSGTNVTEQTTSSGATGVGQQSSGLGDINVEAGITWNNPAATLTLDAFHGINVSAPVSGAGQVVMSAATGNVTLNSTVSGQAGVKLTTSGNFVNNAGANAVSAGSGARWLVYSTNPTLDTTGGLTPDFIQYAAGAGTTPTPTTGSGFLYSVSPTLSVTALTGPVTKTYDGTTTATIAGSNMTASGLLNGDTVTSAGGTYASADAGSGINVTSSTDASTLVVANGSIPVYGYGLSASSVTAAIGTISPKQLTATIIGTPTKTYDGTTTATLNSGNYSFSGFVTGQSATVSQPSSVGFASADASPNAVINATFGSTNFTAGSGTNLANYILPTTATGPGVINPAPVNLTGLLAMDKTYDGTNAAALNTGNAGIFGVIAPDVGSVSLDKSAAAATFSQSNAGNNLAVTVTPGSFQLTGAKAADYTLIAPGDLKANIGTKGLTLSSVAGTNKIYDGNTSDLLDFSHAVLNNVLATDAANVAFSSAGATGTFASSDAASGIAVSVTGVTLTGTAASNYSLAQPTGLSANITPKPLTVTLGGNQVKPYNGTRTATVEGTDFTITGFVGTQSASITQNALAQYGTANAGSNIAVTATLEASDFTPASGTLMSNYSFPHTVTGSTGTINPIALSAYITNNPTKTYDGNTTATVTSADYVVTGFVGSESATVTQPNASYGAPDAGPETVTASVSAANFTAGSGTLLSNYILPTTISGAGTIQPQQLGVNYIYGSIVGNPTKVYDGTTVAHLNPANFQLTGFVAGQGATVTQTTGQYSSANVGTQAVTAQLSAGDFIPNGGTNLSNYTLPSAVYGSGTITPAPLAVSIVGNPTKVYDGTTTTALSPSNYQVTGFVAGQGAVITPSSLINYDSKDVGSHTLTADLTASAYTPDAGTLMSNYILATSATGPGQITPAPLYVIGVAANNRAYNGTTGATLNISNAGLGGLVTGESALVTLNTTTSGSFAQADVGNGISVSTSGFSISGSGASNYALQPVTGLRANITPASLTIQQVTANAKSYDGTTQATLSTGSASLQGVFGSDDVGLDSSGATGTFVSANAATGIPVSAGGFTLSGTKAFDYSLSQPTGLTATINPAVITATIIGNPTKQYDGSNSATLTDADYQLTGFAAGQGASVPQSATANYLSANAGNHIGLESTLVISDFVPNAGTNLANYAMPSSATGTLGTITPKVLNLTGTRVYDTTTDANGTLFGTLTGLNGDTLTVSGSGTLLSKNVGTQNFASLGNLTLNANGAALASNYTLVGGTDWVKITPATLTVTGTTGSSKTYDGTTSAAISGATLNGVLGGDTVNLANDTAGNFTDKNVGTNKTIITAMTVTGADAGNYTLVQPSNVQGSITADHITVTATGRNKVYDATTSDNPILASSGVIGGDVVSFTGTANFDTADVGTGKAVSVINIGKSGADAGNYILDNATATTTADITPRVLNLQGTRVYDTTTNADSSLFGSSGTLTGVAGQTLILSGTGTLTSKNVNSQQTFSSLNTLTLSDGANGGLASNYTLVGGTDWVNITPAPLTVINTAVTPKTYDGTTTADLTGATLQGVLSGDHVSLGNATTGTFSDKNVGTNKTVTTAMTISDTDAGNYTLTQPTLLGTISSKSITVTATGVDKSYDGTTVASVNLSSSQLAPGDSITFADTSATFADKNAATGIAIDVQGIHATGTGAGNYTLSNTTATTSANINPLVINLSGTRVYDNDVDAAASLFAPGGALVTGIGTETLVLTGSGVLASKNVNSAQPFSSPGTLSLADGTHGGLASNYTLVGGVDEVNITPLHITVAANGANKVYDGNTLDPGLTLGSTGVLGGDSITFAHMSEAFVDKNVANGKSITVSGISISGGTDAANYVIDNSTATTTANITPKSITVTATGTNKVYDATTYDAVTLTSGQVVLGDDVTFSAGSSVFGDKNVGAGKTVLVGGIVASGNDVGNYAFNHSASAAADITPAPLTVVNTQASSKTYDGNTVAALTGATLNGILGNDDVTLRNYTTGSFIDANAGSGKSVTTAMTISGGDIGNYTLVQPTGLTANISQAVLNLTGTRQYDGTTNAAAALFGNAGVLNGVNGETLTLGGTGGLNSKNVNPAQGFADLTGFSLSGNGGALASNYTLSGGIDWVKITPAPLNIIGALASDKIYDGTTIAALTGATLSGVIGTDDVTLGNSATGIFSDKNVGTGKAVTTAMTVGGGDAGNYTLAQPTGLHANITQRSVTVVAIGIDKVYDGDRDDQVTLATTGLIAGDAVLTADASAMFVDKNVGNAKSVSVTGITLSGADAGNYSYNTTTTTAANITPKAVTVAASAQDKVYDGNTNAPGTTLTASGILQGDVVSFNGTSATFDDKNVGNGKNVTVTGISGTGADAGNYSYNSRAVSTANITPAPLTVTGTQTTNRTYDGTVADLLSGATLSGVVSGDSVTLDNDKGGTFASKNAGTAKAVSTAMTISGADAGNYVLTQPTGLVADVTAKTITVAATGTNKVYDGNTGDKVTLASNGIVSGDDVTFTNGSASFSSALVGDDKTVTATGIRIAGADAGNYALASDTATTTADIKSGTGVQDTAVAVGYLELSPDAIATPYGVAPADSPGQLTGNKKRLHRPVEANAARVDFESGLALQVVDGGVRMPAQ